MGCSSSSTQTVAQEKRPGTKPEEADGDMGLVASNGIVAENAEIVADQMHLQMQSAVLEELCPGLGDSEEPDACEIIQKIEIVAEQTITGSEATVHIDLLQTTEGTVLDEPAAPTGRPNLQEPMGTSQDVTVSCTAMEEALPAEADSVPVVEAPPTEEPVVLAAPEEPAALVEGSEAPGDAQVPEASPSQEKSVAEHTISSESVNALEADPDPVALSTELGQITEATAAPEPKAVAEPDAASETAPIVEAIAEPKPEAAAEASPALEHTPDVESSQSPETAKKETLVVADPIALEVPELSSPEPEPSSPEPEASAPEPEPSPPEPEPSSPEPEPSAPASSGLQPVYVETAAVAAAIVVLPEAQECSNGAATTADTNTPDHTSIHSPETPDGGVGEGEVSQTDEAKLAMAVSETHLTATVEE